MQFTKRTYRRALKLARDREYETKILVARTIEPLESWYAAVDFRVKLENRYRREIGMMLGDWIRV